ncbi:MAG: ATP-dependent 6-phosphofructokinase [Spirochaetaceae bacterium]|jgi:6-phosphofructokinase 1|nr:ATP-dependent 6-phosphofructokinase [Spirochaetaceae bacterium]
MSNDYDFTIETLGKCNLKSPIVMSKISDDYIANYARDDQFIRMNVTVDPEKPDLDEPFQKFEVAGPREMIYFSPQHVHAGIVSCGGLCPGINDVIRSIVHSLWYRYGVRRISGIRFGYLGFLPDHNFAPIQLNPSLVDDIHKIGGSFLGTARGGGNEVSTIVDTMEQLNLNMLFTIGGDGTQRGSLDIAEEISKRHLKIAMVGIPKTVDNDFFFIQKSFGFDTAVAKAVQVVASAHMEAHSQNNGIGLVKVMGRESGFIAAHTALASHEVNFVLIPEIPFNLEGYNGFFRHLQKRLESRHHAVIVVAEGAMQEQLMTTVEKDAGGNIKLVDVGPYLKKRIQEYFTLKKIDITLKYIDPSYIIRSAPAISSDSIYCERLGNAAVHAAMAGKTKLIIGLIHNEFVHIPMKAAVARRSHVDPESSLWRDTIEATHQPVLMVNQFDPSHQ